MWYAIEGHDGPDVLSKRLALANAKIDALGA